MALRENHGPELDTILSRYADRRSAGLRVREIAQEAGGRLRDGGIREVAEILGLPATDVFEVVGFYTLFYNKPVGTWVLQVCDDVPCCFLGAEQLVATLESKLGIAVDQTTPDGMFTLQRVKCLADCDRAPLLQANLEYYRNIDTPEKVDALITDLRQRAAAGETLSISGRLAER